MGYGLDPYTPIKKSYQIKFIVILLQNILHKTQNKKKKSEATTYSIYSFSQLNSTGERYSDGKYSFE